VPFRSLQVGVPEEIPNEMNLARIVLGPERCGSNGGSSAIRLACDGIQRGRARPDSWHILSATPKYRGVHLVEAFVISKRDNRIVAQSEPFRVMIE
jgi:hypothetical protein